MTTGDAAARIAALEARNRYLEQENLCLETAAFSYRVVLEHLVALSVAVGADVGEAVEVLQEHRRPKPRVALRRVQ